MTLWFQSSIHRGNALLDQLQRGGTWRKTCISGLEFQSPIHRGTSINTAPAARGTALTCIPSFNPLFIGALRSIKHVSDRIKGCMASDV